MAAIKAMHATHATSHSGAAHVTTHMAAAHMAAHMTATHVTSLRGRNEGRHRKCCAERGECALVLFHRYLFAS